MEQISLFKSRLTILGTAQYFVYTIMYHKSHVNRALYGMIQNKLIILLVSGKIKLLKLLKKTQKSLDTQLIAHTVVCYAYL